VSTASTELRSERLRTRSGPLHYPAFRRALAGRAISTAGSWMQTVAAGWLVFDLTGSAAAVGVLTFLSRGPGALIVEPLYDVAGGDWGLTLCALATAVGDLWTSPPCRRVLSGRCR
jgi:hypothetical protein